MISFSECDTQNFSYNTSSSPCRPDFGGVQKIRTGDPQPGYFLESMKVIATGFIHSFLITDHFDQWLCDTPLHPIIILSYCDELLQE